MDTNGFVTINLSAGTVGGREKATALVTPTQEQWSFAALVDGLLSQLTNASGIVIDTVNRTVRFTDDSAKVTLLKNAVQNNGTGKIAKYTPDAGQTGRSLTWSVEAVDGTLDAGIDSHEALVNAAKPKKSVSSLVTGILTLKDADGNSVTPPKLIMIDQVAVDVTAVEDNNTAAVAAVNITTGNSGLIELSEPTVDGEPTPLAFEGGLIG